MKNLNVVAKVAVGLLLGGVAAMADVRDINGVKVIERNWNDYPNSTLSTVNNYPTEVSFTESNFGEGGYANQHLAWLSSDGGATARGISSSEGFDFSVEAYLDAGSLAPRKEAGIRATTVFGDALFIITSDGEVAAFGGNWPFYKWGNDAYDIGTVATMRVIHDPVAKTLEYVYNGVSSGPLAFAADGPNWTEGGNLGVYGQFAPEDSNKDEYGIAQYGNFNIVPEPASLALLAVAGLLAIRRR